MKLPFEAQALKDRISTFISDQKLDRFDDLALAVFRFQYQYLKVYRRYCDGLGVSIGDVSEVSEIPFLPIQLFREHDIWPSFFKDLEFPNSLTFESSGTTGTKTSRHWVADLRLYTQSFLTGFEHFFGSSSDYCIIGLLPSYFERENSSLVHMVHRLIKESGHHDSGFYLNEFAPLAKVLTDLEKVRQPTLLIGVTFGLLDFAELYSIPLKHTKIIETGGMKGRRREMIRAEVHELLQNAFGLEHIYSEYGMTELLSQAYMLDDQVFSCPHWMKVVARDISDPLSPVPPKSAGALNIIDLANVFSCAFIATDDVGTVNENGSFDVTGRLDSSDMRGCNLMVS